MRSFRGDPALKAALLAAIDDCIARAALVDVTLGGRAFAPWSFAEPPSFDVAAAVLALPEDLLRLGAQLFQGFPEDAPSTADHLQRARTWLAALPVGAELGDLTRELALWRLMDPVDGVVSFVTRPEVRSALHASEAALILHDEPARLEALTLVQALSDRLGAEVGETWRGLGEVPAELYAHLRALETARAALEIGVRVEAAAELAHHSVFGGFGVAIPVAWRTSEAMPRWFLARLAEITP